MPRRSQRVEQDWRAYVERMLDYGNNAIAVPLLLELIDFDRVQPRDGRGAARVYDAASRFARATRPCAAPSGRCSTGPAAAACRCSSRRTCWR